MIKHIFGLMKKVPIPAYRQKKDSLFRLSYFASYNDKTGFETAALFVFYFALIPYAYHTLMQRRENYRLVTNKPGLFQPAAPRSLDQSVFETVLEFENEEYRKRGAINSPSYVSAQFD